MRARYIIGVDEVGRGPLAGPLCIGACAVRSGRLSAFRTLFRRAKDCKQLAPRERERWLSVMHGAAEKGVVAFVTAFVGHQTIDEKGMAHALRVGVCRALKKLKREPSACRVLLDGGLRAPRPFTNQTTIIGGDEKEKLIALASIAAKVRRDRRMVRLAARFPHYGFETHKGYGTKLHYARLRAHGPCAIHRKTFIHTRSFAGA